MGKITKKTPVGCTNRSSGMTTVNNDKEIRVCSQPTRRSREMVQLTLARTRMDTDSVTNVPRNEITTRTGIPRHGETFS